MKNNFYISFGIWLAIIPFLGIPNLWRSILIVASGIFLVIVFAGPIILKKLQAKKPKKKKIISDPIKTTPDKQPIKETESEGGAETSYNEITY